jgi:GxxExxY protein
MENLEHKDLTDRIIRAFYRVYNTLGYGFLEKVYENALAITLRGMGLRVEQQIPVRVYFEGQLVGEYIADILVEGVVLLELKSAETIHQSHKAQLLNYLKATRISVGLILNFGPKAEFVRQVFTHPHPRKSA